MAKNQRKSNLKQWEVVQYGRMKLNTRLLEDGSDEYRFPIWTAVQDCENQHCIAVDFCPADEETRRDRKCQIIMNYLRQAEDFVYKALGDEVDEFELFKVGMHIIPLYKQLARLKILEMSVSSRNMQEMTKSGTTKIHGVFKALTDTHNAIIRALTDLGINKVKAKEMDPSIPTKPAMDYYERMEKEATKEGQGLKLVKRHG